MYYNNNNNIIIISKRNNGIVEFTCSTSSTGKYKLENCHSVIASDSSNVIFFPFAICYCLLLLVYREKNMYHRTGNDNNFMKVIIDTKKIT